MALSYLNTNQTANGSGQSVPNASWDTGLSAPYQTFVATITGTGTFSASVQIQGSNDGTNWVNVGTALAVSNSTPSVGLVANTTYKYFRATVASITGTGATVNTTMNT